MVTADSTFATLLLRGLRGDADFFRQGLVSADELGIYLSREVPKHSQRSQTPQFSHIGNAKLSEGKFFFLTEDSRDEIERRAVAFAEFGLSRARLEPSALTAACHADV